MKEMPDINENPNGLNELTRRLLSEEMDRADFLVAVLALDQADPERKSSVLASELLMKPEISVRFVGTDEEVTFYSVRSLSLFHRVQIQIAEGHSEVMDDLQQVLSDSEQIGEDDMDWTNYVRATIAYLNNDSEELLRLVNVVRLNKELVQNFIDGLAERGHPDYLVDYSKPRV
jgi:hypothetical protein